MEEQEDDEIIVNDCCSHDDLLDKLSSSVQRISYLENQNSFLRLKLKLTIKHCLDNVRFLFTIFSICGILVTRLLFILFVLECSGQSRIKSS